VSETGYACLVGYDGDARLKPVELRNGENRATAPPWEQFTRRTRANPRSARVDALDGEASQPQEEPRPVIFLHRY